MECCSPTESHQAKRQRADGVWWPSTDNHLPPSHFKIHVTSTTNKTCHKAKNKRCSTNGTQNRNEEIRDMRNGSGKQAEQNLASIYHSQAILMTCPASCGALTRTHLFITHRQPPTHTPPLRHMWLHLHVQLHSYMRLYSYTRLHSDTYDFTPTHTRLNSCPWNFTSTHATSLQHIQRHSMTQDSTPTHVIPLLYATPEPP